MRLCMSIAELRAEARRRVPRAIFEYADRGAYDEVTLRRNRAAFDDIELRQRVMIDISRRSLATTVLGEPWSMPVAIAPTGLTGLFHRNGEIEGALAAEACGVPFTLSTMSICSVEDVRAAVRKPFWFQLYMLKDRGFNDEMVARARAAGCSALMLTADLVLQGVRRRDAHNGLTIPPRLTLANALDIMSKPRWAMGVLFGKRRTFGNLAGRVEASGGLGTLSQWIAAQSDCSIGWQQIEWLRSVWPGRIIVKGILDAEDARLAVASGVDAIVVSNHGGRQLDGAAATLEVLPEVVEAVGGRCEVLFDGGVQCGQDVLKALAYGARACLVGKSFLYGLAAGGRAGVARRLELLRAELEVSMALCGVTDVREVDTRVLRRR
ncbi:MAG: alpha-hydroxy-acid oxidizing protein [Gammaproteobacteria bacterium]|nr:alpha-hydroxy-acid oxidizing protein [Gammaproteobacteria bacterium]